MSAKQPNILVFLWDTSGWGELGCYGGGVLRSAPTPQIDRFASEGKRLLNFNVGAEPPIKPGTPDAYNPPKPGECRAEQHPSIGLLSRMVTALVWANGDNAGVSHDPEHQAG